jgi:hypothetical protein
LWLLEPQPDPKAAANAMNTEAIRRSFIS